VHPVPEPRFAVVCASRHFPRIALVQFSPFFWGEERRRRQMTAWFFCFFIGFYRVRPQMWLIGRHRFVDFMGNQINQLF